MKENINIENFWKVFQDLVFQGRISDMYSLDEAFLTSDTQRTSPVIYINVYKIYPYYLEESRFQGKTALNIESLGLHLRDAIGFIKTCIHHFGKLPFNSYMFDLGALTEAGHDLIFPKEVNTEKQITTNEDRFNLTRGNAIKKIFKNLTDEEILSLKIPHLTDPEQLEWFRKAIEAIENSFQLRAEIQLKDITENRDESSRLS